MSRPASMLVKQVVSSKPSLPLYGAQYVAGRTLVMKKNPGLLKELVRSTVLPVHELPANQIVLRFVPFPAKYPLNYYGLLSVPPDMDVGDGVGGYSKQNRFTGLQPDATPGLNGSYWGLPSGVAAEDLYYSCFKGWDGSGPKRLLARTTPLAVQWLNGLLGYGVDSEMPSQLIFSGNCCTDLVVSRTIRKIVSLNLNVGDPKVIAALETAQSKSGWRALLDSLQYQSIAEGIADPDFPDFARALAHAGALKLQPDAIWARSARAESASGLAGFDESQASNLVLLGDGRSTLCDRLLGLGVIEVRSDSNGVQASVAPLHGSGARYDDGQVRSLAVIPPRADESAKQGASKEPVTS